MIPTRPITDAAPRLAESPRLDFNAPAPPSANVVRREVDKRTGTIKPPPREVPAFTDYHGEQLRALGLTDPEIEALRHEVDRDAGDGVTPVGRGAEAVRRATERAKTAQKERLTASENAELMAQARVRFESLELPPFPDYPTGQVSTAVAYQLVVKRDAVVHVIADLIRSEAALAECRKSAGKQANRVNVEEMQRAIATLEVDKARLENACESYVAHVQHFADPGRREKATDLNALLEQISVSAFEEDLAPLVAEAGIAFDEFCRVVERIRTFVDERQKLLSRARILAKQLGIKPNADPLPDPRVTSYLDIALTAVSRRARNKSAEPFLAGSRDGFRALGDTKAFELP